jgi:hypothetical protein
MELSQRGFYPRLVNDAKKVPLLSSDRSDRLPQKYVVPSSTGPSGHVLSMKGERNFVAPLPGPFYIFRPVISGTEPVHLSQVGGNILDLLDSSKAKGHVKQISGSLAALKAL